MRVAPVGLMARDPATVFGFGSATACLKNGHPSGCLIAGRLAALINGIVAGTRRKSRFCGHCPAQEQGGHQEVLLGVEAALQLASEGDPTPEKVETLGGGWVGMRGSEYPLPGDGESSHAAPSRTQLQRELHCGRGHTRQSGSPAAIAPPSGNGLPLICHPPSQPTIYHEA